MISNRMTMEQYREHNRVRCGGAAGSVRKNNPKTKVLRQTISALSGLLGSGPMGVHAGPFAIEIAIHGPCRSDIDNIAKGILDALNRTAYLDDRQCIELIVRRDNQDSF